MAHLAMFVFGPNNAGDVADAASHHVMGVSHLRTLCNVGLRPKETKGKPKDTTENQQKTLETKELKKNHGKPKESTPGFWLLFLC